MMDRLDRYAVTRVREAKTLSIVIDGGYNERGGLVVDLSSRKGIDLKKLSHDIALSIQSAIINARG